MEATKQKVSFQIAVVLLELLNNQLKEIPISRDLFFSNLLKKECEFLAISLKGKRLTDEVKIHIAERLRGMERGTKPVSMVIDSTVVSRLNEIVAESNIVRDAFINRLIYLLVRAEKLTGKDVIGFDEDEPIPFIPSNPLQWIKQVSSDPLCYVRDSFRNDTYLGQLSGVLVGLTCYAEDLSDLPGTGEYEKRMKELENSI